MNNQYLKTAIKAAEEAGKILMKNFHKEKKIEIKSGRANIVTQADKKSEKAILAIIQKEFPSHKIFTEEAGFFDSNSDYYWLVDPLDGTNPYSSRQFNFGISIALLYGYRPILGVTYLPFFKEMFWAQKGKGAFLNRKKIFVNKTNKLIEAHIYSDYSHKNGKRNMRETFLNLVEETRRIYSYSSSAVGLSFVACGRFDGYVHNNVPGAYDIAAGTFLIQEAGGRITDFNGDLIDWKRKNDFQCLATNGKIHDQIIKILKKKK